MNPIEELRAGARRRPRGSVGVAVLLVLAVAAVVTAVVWPRDNQLPKNAAFSYRGSVTTIAALQDRMHVLSALYGVEEPKDASAQDQYWRAAAQADAMSLILDHAAAAAGIVITDQKAEALLQQMVSSQLSGNPTTALDALLKKFSVTKADVLAEIKRQEEIALLFQQVTKTAAVVPSVADAMAYFNAHASDFAVPQRRHLLNIVVATKSQAEALINAAKHTDFGALAKRDSLDDATRAKGGDLGTVAASALDSTYAKAAFGARINGFFGPVQTEYGWNVGKVLSIVPGRSVTFASVRKNVVSALQSSRALAAWKAWLTNQIVKADVRYAQAYRPADPLRLPTVGIPTNAAS